MYVIGTSAQYTDPDQRHNLLRRPVPIHIYICNHEPRPSLYNSRRLQRYAVPTYIWPKCTRVYTYFYIFLIWYDIIEYDAHTTSSCICRLWFIYYCIIYYIIIPFRLSRDGGRERCRCIIIIYTHRVPM